MIWLFLSVLVYGIFVSLNSFSFFLILFPNNSNDVQLHSAIDYVAPKDRLSGHDQVILAERKRKFAQARKQRRLQHQNEPTTRANSAAQLLIV